MVMVLDIGHMLSTRQVSVIAVMTAASVSTNYLLIGVVNVKFMDLIVFVSGLTFGPLVGLAVGTLTWMVYGTLNPYGFSLPILVATCLGESIYGMVGGLLNRAKLHEAWLASGSSLWVTGLKFAIVGFLLTFVYDLFTNIVSGVVIGLPISLALVAGIPFALIHEVSNAAFFFVGASPLVRAVNRLQVKEETRR